MSATLPMTCRYPRRGIAGAKIIHFFELSKGICFLGDFLLKTDK